MTWLSIIVLIPLGAVVFRSFDEGAGAFWDAISEAEAVAAIKLTVITSFVIVAINAVMGTMIAWVLVRDEFRGKAGVNSLIGLPFALPTIVAGLTLPLYGQDSPLGINITYTKVAVRMALLFVTLPFVVRAVRPVLQEARRGDGGELTASLGSNNFRIFRSIILPNLTPAIIAGSKRFARAIGEFGSLVLITGNIPFDAQVASVYIFGRIESDNTTAAAAVSVFLLFVAVAVLFALNLFGRWRSRHERA